LAPYRCATSPHLAEDFAADVLGASLAIGEEAEGRRDDGEAQTAAHDGDLLRLRVSAAPRLGDAAKRLDDALALGAVLQADAEDGLAVHLDLFDVLEVALADEYVRERLLVIARRHVHGRHRHGCGVADTREHVGYWICMHPVLSSVGAVSPRSLGTFTPPS